MELCLDGRASTQRSVVALGMFDGVHLGHQVLLSKAKHIAQQENVPMVCFTFAAHPLELVAPEECPPMLTTLDERAKLMEKAGVDIFCAMPFTLETRDMPPAEFVGQLVRRWHPVAVVAGYNYTYGRKAEGNAAWLTMMGPALGFQTEIVPEIRLGGESISSTRIRGLLAQGKAGEAARLLGRPYLRQAEVMDCAQNRFEAVLIPNGKQNVGPGKYRALIDAAGKSWPAAVLMDADGHARGTLHAPLSQREEIAIRFLRGANE
ncbi:MAG: FAD synthetase family protein [Eubacteriales bacterium]|nr:FAD synthetase family protein [Eubacteriales bacterium]